MKVIFCVPTLTRPYQATLDSLKSSIPLIQEAGWAEGMVSEIGCPYISAARSTMLRKALDAKADVIVFIDHDVSWEPGDLLKLIETKGDVVAGIYRFKKDEEEYMGVIDDGENFKPKVREDGAIKATRVPAGFLKITKEAVNKFMTHYPELCYGQKYNLHVDLFNHGAIDGAWWGEDYAFSKRWIDAGSDIWIVPDLDLDHNSQDKCYKGNYHKFLLKQEGGSEYKGN
ncbi:A197 proteiN-transferasE [Caudoviricetes sp.]|nr:A197 proteiN-transferasE [Caudoviricetes sp.]